MTTTVKLSKKLTTHQGDVMNLTFRPVTAGLVRKHMMLPLQMFPRADGQPPMPVVDYALAGKYISDLTGVDDQILDTMGFDDFQACVNHLFVLLGIMRADTSSPSAAVGNS